MTAFKVTRAQKEVLQVLSRKDISTIRRNPAIVSGSKHLLLACKKAIRKLKAMPKHAGQKKRETTYKRIIAMCEKAIEEAGH